VFDPDIISEVLIIEAVADEVEVLGAKEAVMLKGTSKLIPQVVIYPRL
jgi:Flp pilus assembly secretin CpaC